MAQVQVFGDTWKTDGKSKHCSIDLHILSILFRHTPSPPPLPPFGTAGTTSVALEALDQP